jgi:hypothetical protein
MLSILQTLTLLFATAFILGFLSRDIQAIFNPPKPVTDGAATGTPEPSPNVPAPPLETSKT